MFFLAFFAVLLVLWALLPRAYLALEVLVFAPLVGVAFGGFAWGVAGLLFSAVLTPVALCSFIASGVLSAELAFARLRKSS